MQIRAAKMSDWEEIVKIEAACFPPAEAASSAGLKVRMETFLHSFLVMEADGELLGYVGGMVTDQDTIIDEMYEDAGMHRKDGAWQSIFSLAVLPKAQRQGIGGKLLQAMEALAREDGREGCILTCKDVKIHYYQKFGYEKLGVSASVHGGAVWYDMILRF